jgi:phosphate transport system permease protein
MMPQVLRMDRVGARKLTNALALVSSALATLVGLAFLTWILVVIGTKGAAAINWGMLSRLPAPPGIPGGGLANALLGTLAITTLATVLAVPIGLLAGIHLSEYGERSPIAAPVRFLANVFVSAPSIVVGVFVYAVMVVPMGRFSGLAGGVSLAIIMLPVVTRVAEDVLKLVPVELREAALALGAPYWHVVLHVVLRGGRAGLVTGCLLAVARVAGETAPLLFTALNSPYWPKELDEPTANLTVTIFNYAMSPYDDWQTQAWGGALLLTLSVLVLNISARILFRSRKERT